MKLGKAVPDSGVGVKAAFYVDEQADEEKKSSRVSYDATVQAPQIYGKTKRAEINTIAPRARNTGQAAGAIGAAAGIATTAALDIEETKSI